MSRKGTDMMLSAVVAAGLAVLCQFSQPLCDQARVTPISLDSRLPGAFGYYDNRSKTVHLDPHITDRAEVALELAHELQNARYDAQHGGPYTAAYCIAQDSSAYATQAAFWQWYWNGADPRAYVPPDRYSLAFVQNVYAQSNPLVVAAVVQQSCTPALGW
ncbi:MAG: hypothetical protein KGJ86_07055 [Chloroflexota bacterium]|nr:hypothetical protein [Chloroflexota bacterium]